MTTLTQPGSANVCKHHGLQIRHLSNCKDTVFESVHVLRLAGVSVAGREVEGVILQVILHGVADQSFQWRKMNVSGTLPGRRLCPAAGSATLHEPYAVETTWSKTPI